MGNTGTSFSSGSGGSFSFSGALGGSSSLSAPPPPSPQDQHFFLDCAKRGDFATIRRLVEANELYVNVQPRGRWAALHQFAEKGSLAAVQFLLEHGADPTARTREGLSPADVAKKPEVQAALLDAGAPLSRSGSSRGKRHSPGGGSSSGVDVPSLPDMRSAMLPLESSPMLPLETVAMVRDVAPKRSEAEVAEAVRKAGGDMDLAMEALLTDPPSIAEEPEKWFHHFDMGGDGLLQEHEVVVALWHSLEEENKADIAKLVHRKWPEFDWDGRGALDFARFTEAGGLRDFIVQRWGEQLVPEPEFEDCKESAEDLAALSPSGAHSPEAESMQEGTSFLDTAIASLQDDGILAVCFTARLINDFTSILRERYRRFRELGLHFEVLFVSMDADRAAFEAHGSMDWRTVPFGSRSARQWLAGKLEVRSVPQLVLLKKDGSTVNQDARKALFEDPDGHDFPWMAPLGEPDVASEAVVEKKEEVDDSGRRKMRSVVQSIIGRQSSSEKLVDDISLARTAARAPLTEEGYREVAAFKSNYAMKRFAQRVIATKQWVCLDNEGLTRLIWEHSGVHKTQSLERLLKDLRTAKWIVEADACGEEDEEGTPSSTPAASPVHDSDKMPPALPGLRTAAFRHAFISQRLVGSLRASRKASREECAGIAEGEEGEEGEEEGSGGAAGGKAGGEEAGATTAVTLVVPSLPPPGPPEDSETEEGTAASPALEKAPPGKGPGKGLGKGPPGGAKGRGKAPGPPPPPAAGGGTDEAATAPEASGESPAAEAGEAKSSPGKGPPPPGKGKGPPPPPGKGKGPPPPPGKGEGPPPPPGKGKSPPPPPGKGKGPPPPSGKGPPPPGGKGGSPAPPGKGPPGKGKAAGRPAWGKGGAQPTREDVDEWKAKKKNPLRWKRVLQEGDDGLFDDSLFAGEDVVDVDDEGLEVSFSKDAKTPVVVVITEEKEVLKKPILWAPTEKKTPEQRRQMIAIQMKAWTGRSAWELLERLEHLDFNGIRFDPDFREDRFELLTDLVEQMNESKLEWQRLAETDAQERYQWDQDVEGFFLAMQGVTNFKERFATMKLGLMVEREIAALSNQAEVLRDGMQEVLQSAVLRLVFRKILCIGNRLNAGEAKFSRADGFDVVALLEATDFLRAYKGQDQVNLLRHLQEKELHEENFEELAHLAVNLKEIQWKPPKPLLAGQKEESGEDPTDLGDLRKRSNDVSRALGILGRFMDALLMRLGSATPISPPTPSGSSVPGAAAEAAAPALPPAHAAVLRQMEEYCTLLEDYKKKSILVESGLDSVEESLDRLHRFLAHKPPKGKELIAGHSLGVVAYFVRMLAAADRAKQKKRSVPSRKSSAGRASTSGPS